MQSDAGIKQETPNTKCNRDQEKLNRFLASSENQMRDCIPCQKRGVIKEYLFVSLKSFADIRDIRVGIQ